MFTEQGYGATVRVIAGRAGVDPAMVNHWFGSKEGLFAEAVLELPMSPHEVVQRVLPGDRDQLGERVLRMFLTLWDAGGGGQFTALARSVATHEIAAEVLREVLLKVIFRELARAVGDDRVELRATLCASQLVGLGWVRYVLHAEPLASQDVDTLVRAVAPNIQRYLTGDLG